MDKANNGSGKNIIIDCLKKQFNKDLVLPNVYNLLKENRFSQG